MLKCKLISGFCNSFLHHSIDVCVRGKGGGQGVGMCVCEGKELGRGSVLPPGYKWRLQQACGEGTRHTCFAPGWDVTVSCIVQAVWLSSNGTPRSVVVLTGGCHSSPVSSQEALRQIDFLLLHLHPLLHRQRQWAKGMKRKGGMSSRSAWLLCNQHIPCCPEQCHRLEWDLSSKQLRLSSKPWGTLRN